MRKYEIAVLSKGAFARTVRIYSPKHADRALIMHDGQNAFDDADASYGKSWRMLDAVRALGIKNVAIIGIDSTTTRLNDYIPFPSELEKYGFPNFGGNAEVYFDYLESIILPYLDKRFGYGRYAMLGSSAGAIATLCFAARKPAKFSAYGMFSTPLFLSGDAFDRFLNAAQFDASALYRIYTGGSERVGKPEYGEQVENMFVADAFKLTDALRNKGIKDLTLAVDNTGIHDETCWREPACAFLSEFSKLK